MMSLRQCSSERMSKPLPSPVRSWSVGTASKRGKKKEAEEKEEMVRKSGPKIVKLRLQR